MNGEPPPGQLAPELETLLGLWRGRYGGRPIPESSRFGAGELQPWERNAVWIEARDDGFRLRGFGIDLIRRFGRYGAGHNVDEFAPDIATGLREALWRAMAAASPVAAGASVRLGRRAAIFSDLILPIAGDGRRVTLLLLASYELDAPL
jgi:hypothetical protein